MANTLSSRTFRDRMFSKTLQEILRSALVSEAIFQVDRSGNKVLQNPYPSTPVVTNQALAGTYTPAVFTTTDEALNVTRELIVSEHVFAFEQSLSEFDLMANRAREMAMSLKVSIDSYNLAEAITAANGFGNTIAVGGAFSAANVITTLGAIVGRFAGYSQAYNGLYLVIENTDVPAFIQAQVANGFNVADSALRNGFLGSYMGVDIYVVRNGQLPVNKCIAGVKRQCTYAMPVDWRFEEKQVSGKTGYEMVAYGYTGFKMWTNTADLTAEVTL